jgi:hypothetical protein
MQVLVEGRHRHEPDAAIVMVTIKQLLSEANSLIQDLAQSMLPGLVWTTEPAQILSCRSGRGSRATIVLHLDVERLACPIHHPAMMAAARKWMKEHRFPVILDQQHGERLQLVASNQLVAFNIKANAAKIRIKAATRYSA